MKLKNSPGNTREFEVIKGLKVSYQNVPLKLRIDPYHQLHALGWVKAFSYFVALSFIMNSLFATLYWIGPVPLLNSGDSWWEYFLFGIQKISDIGYGHLTPSDLYSEIIVVIHSFFGFTSFALITGYFFSKFSLVRSRIEFTEKATITKFQGQDALVFRIINLRQNNIGEVEITVSLFLDVTGPGGQPLKEGFDLQIVRSKFPIVALCINIIHPIDEHSPLLKCIGEKGFIKPIEILVTVNGIDSTFGQFIQKTKMYRTNDIMIGKNFSNVLQILEDGSYVIDFEKFNQFSENSMNHI